LRSYAIPAKKNSFDVPAVCYGGETDYEAQARDLFEALRHLDDIGAKTVYARCPEPKGVGLAVYNRLMRAAGFEVLKLA
jgi:L-threonylcarbamoyladenylate synthase